MGNDPEEQTTDRGLFDTKSPIIRKRKMEWQDQDAPIILGEMKERTYTFDEAAAFILENFKNSVPKWLILRKKL